MNWLRKFMIGRYGVDQLSMFLLGLSIIFSLVSRFVDSRVINIVFLTLAVISYYRIVSKDIARRRYENDELLKIWNPMKSKINVTIKRIKDIRKYKRFKCPSCKQALRVPRGKGKIAITCPKCKTGVIKKS